MVLDALGFDGGPPRDELVKRLRSGQDWMIRERRVLLEHLRAQQGGEVQ